MTARLRKGQTVDLHAPGVQVDRPYHYVRTLNGCLVFEAAGLHDYYYLPGTAAENLAAGRIKLRGASR